MNLKESVIRRELLELLTHKSIFDLFFFGIVLLDGLGAIFPYYFNRQVTVFIPLPLVLVLYIINNESKIRKLFIVSICIHFLGICYFNTPYEKFNSVGVIFYTIGFLTYFIILFKYFGVVKIRKLIVIYLIVITVVGIPTFIYSKGMQDKMIFNALLFYIISIILFVVSSLILYLSNKSKVNRFLLFSAISIILCSYSIGYNLFIENVDCLVAIAAVFFNLVHYFMCWFLIQKSKEGLIIN